MTEGSTLFQWMGHAKARRRSSYWDMRQQSPIRGCLESCDGVSGLIGCGTTRLMRRVLLQQIDLLCWGTSCENATQSPVHDELSLLR